MKISMQGPVHLNSPKNMQHLAKKIGGGISQRNYQLRGWNITVELYVHVRSFHVHSPF